MSSKKPKEPAFMRELHKIREGIYNETKKLSSKEIVEKTHQEVKHFLKSQGYRLVKSDKGYRLEHLENSKAR